jgi:drug/metabolite transporter (DMT)-like permease
MLAAMASLHKGLAQIKTYDRRTLLILSLSGFFGMGLSGILYLASVQYAGATKASIISSTSPLFGAPLSFFFLKEHLDWQIGLGIILTVLGIWCVV